MYCLLHAAYIRTNKAIYSIINNSRKAGFAHFQSYNLNFVFVFFWEKNISPSFLKAWGSWDWYINHWLLQHHCPKKVFQLHNVGTQRLKKYAIWINKWNQNLSLKHQNILLHILMYTHICFCILISKMILALEVADIASCADLVPEE